MSMLSYALLGTLQVRHRYFADGLAQRMRFLPDAPTRAWLDAYGLLCRANGHSLAVHAPEERLGALWKAARQAPASAQLSFALRCADPDFTLYSAPGELPPMTLPLLPEAGADEAGWRASLGGRVELQIQARQTRWKYLLLGDWQDQQPQVVDPEGRLSFEPGPAEALGDGRHALVFRSSTELPLSEASQPQLQLADAASAPARILISRLPGAAPRDLRRETLSGRSAAVSEIFVSR